MIHEQKHIEIAHFSWFSILPSLDFEPDDLLPPDAADRPRDEDADAPPPLGPSADP
jgi:hypothetical protein